ncbi:glycosyltransferase family 4 protein [Limisphaera ngatamarikiensis]|uniref:Glycosyltransferase family 4 protein n=1 Tax=Limisphaera ngatamarikiensis TaxID=1324935 RepID=A0A6M1RIA1_9BACT|nr:glycosyltransferase family 4 protein [Limisphaera ngatamarikiensis]NGO39788.1 glycosyltransferase family 4 protein [Limisphaera ngatamarikiensis]
MRVVHVITRLIVGGAQENTLASVLGLRERHGWEVRLISGPTYGPEGSLEGVAAAVPGLLEIEPHLVRPVHPWRDGLAWVRLTRRFRELRPDLVHTHSGKAGFLGRLAAHRAGIPVIVHTIHGPSFGPFQGPLANAVFRWAERRAGRVTTHFVVVAEAMTRQYLAAGIGRPDQYSLIYSGFDLGPYLEATNDPAWRARVGLGPEDLVVGKVARLFKLKGHDDLLAVAPAVVRRCPRARFLFVGDGAWRGRLEARVRALGLAGVVRFAGLVPPESIPRWMGIMDVVVHLSRREGLPRALPQALAAGKPVLAYACDGAPEVCRPGETGILVRPGDLTGLEAGLVQLLEDASLRERLGRQGRAWVREHFDVNGMVDRLHALYVRLLGRTDAAGAMDVPEGPGTV